MLTLKFDYMGLAYDLCEALVLAVDESMQHFISDAKQHLESTDYETEKAILDMAENKITATTTFYAMSIMESYGTGSKMDKTNPALAEYMSSEFWNKLRRSFSISGRGKGSYTNIFGETVESSGKYAGKEIENIVPARSPSFAIQNAEKLLNRGLTDNGYVMRALKACTQNFFDTVDTSKYFHNEEVSI